MGGLAQEVTLKPRIEEARKAENRGRVVERSHLG